jgi:serine protease AprX
MLTDGGVNVVFSAGNTGPANGTLNPYAAAPWVVSVGATDDKGALAGFSSRGVFGDKMFSPSLVAPGVNVVSLRSLGTLTGTLGLAGADTQRLSLFELPFYTTASGTSFTAPQVSAAIALMLQVNPSLKPNEVKDILQRSATPMPKYFSHEVGAGMLNTYAAVLEAAFPERATGVFRAAMANGSAKFSTSSQISGGEVSQNSVSSGSQTPAGNTLQTTFSVAWNRLSPSNLNLSVFDINGLLSGASNRPNLEGIFGHSERVTVTAPVGNLLTQVSSPLGAVAVQNYLSAIETTRVQFADLSDTENLSPQDRATVNEAMRKFLVPMAGTEFQPGFTVSRAELAAAFVRAGKVPQFVAKNPMYADVSDLTTRNAVEAVQSNPGGKLFVDAAAGSPFRPDQPASRLVAAIAMVKAARLDSAACAATLPSYIADGSTIPYALRGYVAVALQKGWLTLQDGNRFAPGAPLTRMDLATAIVALSK